MILASAILLTVTTAFGKPVARVDVWERNHMVNEQGQETLDQVILWRMEKRDSNPDYYVVAWRMADKCRQPERVNGKLRGSFDGREVVAAVARETWTGYDPELLDRERLPVSKRGPL